MNIHLPYRINVQVPLFNIAERITTVPYEYMHAVRSTNTHIRIMHIHTHAFQFSMYFVLYIYSTFYTCESSIIYHFLVCYFLLWNVQATDHFSPRRENSRRVYRTYAVNIMRMLHIKASNSLMHKMWLVSASGMHIESEITAGQKADRLALRPKGTYETRPALLTTCYSCFKWLFICYKQKNYFI